MSNKSINECDDEKRVVFYDKHLDKHRITTRTNYKYSDNARRMKLETRSFVVRINCMFLQAADP